MNEFNDSILNSVKKMLGINPDYDESFDFDIKTHINSVLFILYEMGVIKEFKSINDSETKWSDIIDDINKLEIVKSYIYFKVKFMFDPPSSSTTMEATKDMIKECEWRLNNIADFGGSYE